MNKRLMFNILASIILIIIAYFLFDHGYFNKYNRYAACKDAKKGNVQIVLWSDLDVTSGLERIYSKHDVQTHSIKTTNFNWKGVEIYNERMNKELEKKMGNTSYLKLRNELDSLSQTWIILP